MKREAIKGAAVGMVFTGIGYSSVMVLGFGWISLSVLLYLYVVMGAGMALASSFELLETRFGELLDQFVIVAGEEELKLRKLVSGEKYRVKGELEKL